MGSLDGKFIVLGVTGGIAAYKTCELARLLSREGAEIQVVMTEAGARMVGPVTFQALTGRPAEVGCGGHLAGAGMPHIDLGAQAALIVIAPATANTLAKLAAGLADNLLTSTVLSSTCPVLVAPAMNTRMWENPVTRENMKRLDQLGRFQVVGPGAGGLACGEEGAGRMEEPATIMEAVRRALGRCDLEGRTLLITAGPTREPVDPVRFLSNRSSGKMGYALAAAATRRGAKVLLVSGPVTLEPPPGAEVERVETTAEMARAVSARIQTCDVLLMTAAVADFKPRRVSKTKLKKDKGVPALELQRTSDILGGLARKKHRCLVVGFAAETGDPVPAARKKLKVKKLDLMVANDVSRPDAGFDVDTNVVTLVGAGGEESFPCLPKSEVADLILDRVAGMLTKRRRR